VLVSSRPEELSIQAHWGAVCGESSSTTSSTTGTGEGVLDVEEDDIPSASTSADCDEPRRSATSLVTLRTQNGLGALLGAFSTFSSKPGPAKFENAGLAKFRCDFGRTLRYVHLHLPLSGLFATFRSFYYFLLPTVGHSSSTRRQRQLFDFIAFLL
jgi:hypothetical protein